MKAIFFVLFFVTLFLHHDVLLAENTSAPPAATPNVASAGPAGIESLNLVGADVRMPPFTDTVLGADSTFRRALYGKGFALRSNSTAWYTQNTLDSPVPVDQQTYIGQRQFGNLMANPILTYDMRALHLRGAQLYMAAGLTWVSWKPAGPSSITMSSLYLYKSFAEGHIEVKLGYIANNFEFLGLQVGGALSTGSQGVYAILPYEVGLSHFPFPAPAFNLNLVGPKHLYFKTAIQRSLDAGGSLATNRRNSTGFRFIPNGDKLLNVFEIGYRKAATAGSGQTWVRAGYIHNTTPYPNSRTGVPTSGNFCAYILADHQFLQSDRAQPSHGIYAGISAIGVPVDRNAYTRYYELRIYDQGPFRSRPNDTAALVASYSPYSRTMLANLEAKGRSVWRNSSTLTGSYNVHLSRGVYLSTGLSYHAGPDITPRIANALTFSAILNSFF